jgi:nucleoside-diphosphate-sugar epimerase
MRKILIVGSEGLIGRVLRQKYLELGYTVIGIDNCVRETCYNPGYIRIRNTISGIDAVPSGIVKAYYLAGDPDPASYLRRQPETLVESITECNAFLSLFRNTQEVPLFIASSSEVYSDSCTEYIENNIGCLDPASPRNCYKEGKRAIEVLALSYKRTYNMNIRIGRIFNTYGSGYHEGDNRLIAAVIRNMYDQDRGMSIYGDGIQYRSYCHVDDLIRGIEIIMDENYQLPVNIGNDIAGYSVIEVIEIAEMIIGKKLSVSCRPGLRDMIGTMYRKPDISIMRSFGWEPRISLYDGLKRTFGDYAQEHAGRI